MFINPSFLRKQLRLFNLQNFLSYQTFAFLTFCLWNITCEEMMFAIIHVQLENFWKKLTLIDINGIFYDLLLHCIALSYFLHCDPPVSSEKNVLLFIKGSHSVFPLKQSSLQQTPPLPHSRLEGIPRVGMYCWDGVVQYLIHAHPRKLRLTSLNCLLPSRGVI